MLRKLIIAFAFAALFVVPVLAQAPAFREVRVGDTFEIHRAAKPVYPSPQSLPSAPAAVVQAAPIAYGDSYGFGAWLNGVRARMGLHPLACDAGLCQDAAVNSSRCNTANFYATGHNFMGQARRQNAGVGHGSRVWPMWAASPAHASALFDRSITRYGIACVGGVWTFSAY